MAENKSAEGRALRPVLLTVDDDTHVLRAIRRDLRKAYGDRYRILSASSATEALEIVGLLEEREEDAALFLVDQRMPEMTGVEFLLEAIGTFPAARRVLLTAYADTDAAITAINKVQLHHYLTKPWDPPEERLYPVLDDLLSDWHATNSAGYDGIRVIGHQISPTTHRVRDFLTRNQQPFRFYEVERDPSAAQLAERLSNGKLPLVVFPDGPVLVQPSAQELAGSLGLSATASRPHYDVVIVGGGPAGLAAAVYAASEGLSALLIDAEAPGGQAGTSSRIENYLGFPSGLSGSDLTRRAVAQARRFGAEILSPLAVTSIRRAGPARILCLSDGTEVSAETVILATGVQYNRLDVPGSERFEGAGLYYGAAMTESASCADQHVYIIGGANSAGQAAIHFARFARAVTILVRADSLTKSMSQYLVDEIADTANIEVRTSTRVVGLEGEERLERLTLADGTGATHEVPAGFVFTFIGARPRTEWLDGFVVRDEKGFIATGPDLTVDGTPPPGWELPRDPLLLETSVPGVFAAGDVRARSIKRVASGVGEGAMAVALVHTYRDGL
jgi:thioredoxin reductase (NADPH)